MAVMTECCITYLALLAAYLSCAPSFPYVESRCLHKSGLQLQLSLICCWSFYCTLITALRLGVILAGHRSVQRAACSTSTSGTVVCCLLFVVALDGIATCQTHTVATSEALPDEVACGSVW
jgi:hypothetical protein